MCGIYGIISLNGQPVDAGLMHTMGRVTAHRGPDDEGFHADGPCVIGMRRLSIIDLTGGHQPIGNLEGTLWVVCNGEIYNFRELREELTRQGHQFRTGSDSEVLIHAYAEYGDAFVDRLNGMFGFALWDARRKRLIVGRDRLGIKPIYYTRLGGALAFATEAKALLALPGLQADVDPAALHSYLHLGYVPAPHSMFRGISKLPPACVLTVEAGKLLVSSYWSAPTEVDSTPTEDEWEERVRGQIAKSVQMQMVSDVPIGAFLSGGVDSSAVVAFMAKSSNRPVKTYSIGFTGSSAEAYYNELPYARKVADLFGTDHHEIIVRPDVATLLPRLLWHMDEPVSDTAFITTYLVSEFARRDVKVILSGVGGDELFAGYRRYLGNHYLSYFERLPPFLQRSAVWAGAFLPSDRHSPLLNVSRYAKGFLETAGRPLEDRYESYLRVFSSSAGRELMSRPPDTPYDALGLAFKQARGTDAINRMLVVDLQTQLPDDLLLLTDKMTMAVSLECRVPLLDHELVQLAARIPESIKIRRGRLKHVMRKALAGVLPKEILDRKKRGFGTPMGAWLRGELAPLLRSLLSPATIAARGFLRPAPIQQLITDHEAHRLDGTDPLLALLNFEIWSRIYLDGRPPDDVATELKALVA
jgi:asparagine synthase (glutamine-hydrolysing)